ncbi:hypothetical protein HPB47_004456 [Ixodes persulcatus]|uniref:Uncharacterized protein n=1 Tax=Ixodes persulcatus TaxID=34615 RepID=A0AC60QZA0_IXOPE|nr:hypothetical protein HPB47_004456 [Ixodes persulcatus]
MNREVSEAIPTVNTKITKIHQANLHGAYDRLSGFALELINENRALMAKMAAYKRERAPAPSPASESVAALQRTFSQQQGGAPPVAPTQTTPPPPAAPRESLLVYPASKPAAGPVEPRLGLVEFKQVRGGAIVLGHSVAALGRLAEAIKTNMVSASQLTTRRSEKRAPQVKIVGVDPGVEARDLVETLTSTNGIPTEDQSKVVASFRAASGTMVHTRDMLLQKRGVHLGWTSCPVYENLGVRCCTKCYTYGHTAKVCAGQSLACTECSGDHPGANCREYEKRCKVSCAFRHASRAQALPGARGRGKVWEGWGKGTHKHTDTLTNATTGSGAPAHATLQNPVPMGKVRGRREATVTSPSPWSGGTRAPAHWQPNAKSRAVWGGLRPPSHINCYRSGSVGGSGGSRARVGATVTCGAHRGSFATRGKQKALRGPTGACLGRGDFCGPLAPPHNIKHEVAYTTTGMAKWRETSVGGAPADGRSGGPAPSADGWRGGAHWTRLERCPRRTRSTAAAQAACWDREAGKPASQIQRVWGPGGQSPDPVLLKYPPLVEKLRPRDRAICRDHGGLQSEDKGRTGKEGVGTEKGEGRGETNGSLSL